MPITLPIKTASKTECFHRILFFRPRPLIFGALSIIVKNRIREIKGRNVKKKKSQSIFSIFHISIREQKANSA